MSGQLRIIDVHSHIFRYPEHYGPEVKADFERVWGAILGKEKMDSPPERHWSVMEGRVEKAIVFGLTSRHLGMGVPNEEVAAYVREHSETLVGFLSLDPRDPNPYKTIKRCVEELGLRGVKLGPTYQNVSPKDPRYYPIYAAAQEFNIPILVHMGTTFVRRAPLEYAHPHLLEQVAYDFPDLRIIVAHLAHPWEAETIALVRKQPNIYSDISGLTPRPYRLYQDLVLAMEYGVLHKLLFGSDYPFTEPQAAARELLALNRFAEGTNLPRIPEEAIRRILYDNAKRLLADILY